MQLVRLSTGEIVSLTARAEDEERRWKSNGVLMVTQIIARELGTRGIYSVQ